MNLTKLWAGFRAELKAILTEILHLSGSSYVDSVVMEAQRKVSEAVVTSAMRERRNSFREAVHHGGGGGGGNSNPNGKGGSPHYANIQCGPVNPSLSSEQPSDVKGYQTQQQPVQYFDVSKDATKKPLHPPPNTGEFRFKYKHILY